MTWDHRLDPPDHGDAINIDDELSCLFRIREAIETYSDEARYEAARGNAREAHRALLDAVETIVANLCGDATDYTIKKLTEEALAWHAKYAKPAPVVLSGPAAECRPDVTT